VNVSGDSSVAGQIAPANGMTAVARLLVDRARIAAGKDPSSPCTAAPDGDRLQSLANLTVDPARLPALGIILDEASPNEPGPKVEEVAAAPLEEPAPEPALPDLAEVQPETATPGIGSQSFAAASRDLVAIMTLPSGQAQPQERLFAGDALVGILPHLQQAELANLTRTVARLDLVSERLRSFLVNHPDKDISCRMLKDAQNLADPDLLRLIPKASEQQLRLIARRRLLSMSVCDALVATGNLTVILDLLRNADCRLSQASLDALPDMIAGHEDLMSALCNRADLPQAVGLKLFWQANRNLRRYLLSRFLTESASLGRVMDVGIAAGAIPPLGGQAKPADVEELVAQVEAGRREAAQTLARCCRIAPETAAMIVADPSGEPLAVVFKAMAQSRLIMAQALKRWIASPSCAIEGENRILELHALFDSLSFNKARMLLSYWDWASREAGPYTEALAF
jgi:hypothetical protein